MKIVNLTQRTPEWLAWRNCGLGSSDAPVIAGVSPWGTVSALLAEKAKALKGEAVKGRKDNSAMARGRRLESVASESYSALMGWDLSALCCEHDTLPWLRASLDGYNEKRGLVAEIKAPNKDDHGQALAGEVPLKYLPQCDHLLLATGAKALHYISYNDYFSTEQHLAVVTVRRDEGRLLQLLEMEREFWEEVCKRAKTDKGATCQKREKSLPSS